MKLPDIKTNRGFCIVWRFLITTIFSVCGMMAGIVIAFGLDVDGYTGSKIFFLVTISFALAGNLLARFLMRE